MQCKAQAQEQQSRHIDKQKRKFLPTFGAQNKYKSSHYLVGELAGRRAVSSAD
jgi:hypothetical protein